MQHSVLGFSSLVYTMLYYKSYLNVSIFVIFLRLFLLVSVFEIFSTMSLNSIAFKTKSKKQQSRIIKKYVRNNVNLIELEVSINNTNKNLIINNVYKNQNSTNDFGNTDENSENTCAEIPRESHNDFVFNDTAANGVKYIDDVPSLSEFDSNTTHFFYFGLKDGLQKIYILMKNNVDFMNLDFNIDGLPIHKSTKESFWPILCKVTYSNLSTFTVAIYCGNTKPPLE